MAETVLEPQAGFDPGGSSEQVAGRSPWALAGRRLIRNKVAMAGLLLFLLIVIVSFGAPIYSHDIAHTNPF